MKKIILGLCAVAALGAGMVGCSKKKQPPVQQGQVQVHHYNGGKLGK